MAGGVATTDGATRAVRLHAREDTLVGAALGRERVGRLSEKRVAVEGNAVGVEDEVPQSFGATQHSERVTRSMALELVARGVDDEKDIPSENMPHLFVDCRGQHPRVHETVIGPRGTGCGASCRHAVMRVTGR